MMVGIISGTYSSIFIASPVLTAWKEREPGFIRRRERIAAIDGSVPAFADEADLAMLGDDSETDAEIEEDVAAKREPQPKAGAVATVEPPAESDGGDPARNGEPPTVDPAAVAKSEREAKRRARRQQRRKHGRKR